MSSSDPQQQPQPEAAVGLPQPTPAQQPPASLPGWIVALRVLASGAMLVSLYLLYLSLTGAKAAGCGEGGPIDCNHVIQSKWSNAFGIPVSLLAVCAHGLMLLLSGSLRPGRGARGRHAWEAALLLAGAIASSVLWFIYVQVMLLKAFCLYCSTAHGLGLGVVGLLLAHAPMRGPRSADEAGAGVSSFSRGGVAALLLVGLALTGIMASGAREKGPRVTRLPGGATTRAGDPGLESDRHVFLMAGKIGLALRPAEYPMLGKPTAPHIIAELFDYTCPHCQTLHGHLVEAMTRYPGQLGVVLIPVPLESGCNPRIRVTEPVHVGGCELAKLALAVWRADPAAFSRFDAWLFASERPRKPQEARAFASELLGPEKFERALADPWAAKQLGNNVAFYAQINGGAIPKLLLGSVVMEGRASEPAELFELLEKELELTPTATAPSTAPSPTTAPASAPAPGE